jgi:leucyl-tRNA synthetase
MPVYSPRSTEEKWQKRWEEAKLHLTDLSDESRPKYYNLVMFPYPSGDKLHIGHWYNFAPADSFGRYMRMKGYNVFEPQGYDSFGLPAENYAIKHGVHPTVSIAKNIDHMRKQLREMGAMYDYSKEVVTSDPAYYQWTQWIFLQLYKKGLAYRKNAPVNWCPSCQTVLANEQVAEGRCERCSTEVTKKDLTQWFFKIRDYAERLLNHKGLDWPEKTKLMQKNWIGKSEGNEIYFPLKKKFRYVLLHGFRGSSQGVFFPWLKKELEKAGHECFVPDLPNAELPTEKEQVEFVLKNIKFDENTILFGHSLGSVVAMKVLEKLPIKIAGLVLAGGFVDTKFRDKKRPFNDTFSWQFDFEKIRSQAGFIKIVSDLNDPAIPVMQGQILQQKLDGELIETIAQGPHFDAPQEPILLQALTPRIKVFTTRVDTLFGCTYVVLAPEHPFVSQIIQPEYQQQVQAYIEQTRHKNDIERSAEGKEKTGVFSGNYAVNPVNGEEVPIWVADYVLASYGSGAVMAVPAHDERDYQFAKKYKLPIVPVIAPAVRQDDIKDDAFISDGILIDSGEFTGLKSSEARQKITTWLEEKGQGRLTINYKLRDWLVSRQRYWGAPIPIIYCEKCGEVAVPEKDLPVRLPEDVDFEPRGDGKSPLNTVESFVNVTCPTCGGSARREVDTMDTFVDSSWYFLRYPSANLADKPFDPALTKKWLPVDMYIGGPEHACMHLLYARFINMVLKDLSHIDFEEPFTRLVHQGMITKDGAKMSKSKGNVVSPDQFVEKYGSDTFRMYLMFMGPFTDGGDWHDQGITGIARFVERFYLLMTGPEAVKDQSGLQKNLHRTIKKVGEDVEKFHFNTAVAALMEFVNNTQKTGMDAASKKQATLLIAPLAPHLAEEIWEKLGQQFSIFNESWPTYDESLIVETLLTLPVQVNGKLRGQIQIDVGASKEAVLEAAREEPNVVKYLEGKTVKKEIYVSERLVSFVVE